MCPYNVRSDFTKIWNHSDATTSMIGTYLLTPSSQRGTTEVKSTPHNYGVNIEKFSVSIRIDIYSDIFFLIRKIANFALNSMKMKVRSYFCRLVKNPFPEHVFRSSSLKYNNTT